MNSNEIRCKTGTVEFWLREIAAQLANLNEGIMLLACHPEAEHDQDDIIYPPVTDGELDAQQERHKAAMDVPVSDPEKFTRCCHCEKEVPRPAWCAIGESTICDDCIPF